jgi:hypothetical protein
MPVPERKALDRMAVATRWVEEHRGMGSIPPTRWDGDGVPHWRFAKLTEALAYGSSADATFRVRNSADTGYEDTTTHVEVYAPDLMASGDDAVASGTIVKIDFLCDPRHPHWVATEWRCATS